jgi:serine/threonine protein kinase
MPRHFFEGKGVLEGLNPALSLLSFHLQEYFASKTRLPLTRELELAIDCAKGMAYLHSEGIKKPMTLHRDLKPANVMIFGNVYAHGDKARKEVSYS